jgi:hypothetical protein
MNPPSLRRRGRPPKFGCPTEFVALTLPREVIEGLRKIDSDLAWAIVTLFEKRPPRGTSATDKRPPDTELVSIADRQSLIVVNRSAFKSLPGIQIIPLNGDRAFLALEPGRGMTDLELTVIDRLADPAIPVRERKALKELRARLREWRLAPTLRCHTRTIIVVEQLGRHRRETARRSTART